MLMPYIKGFCIKMRHLRQYTTNKCVYEAFDKHVQVLWDKYFEVMSLVWIKSWHLPNNTGLCWSETEEEKEQEEATTGWIHAEWVVVKRWRNGRNREGKKACLLMAERWPFSICHSIQSELLLQLLPVLLSPHLYPLRKKKKKSTDVIKRSLVRKMELEFVSHV